MLAFALAPAPSEFSFAPFLAPLLLPELSLAFCPFSFVGVLIARDAPVGLAAPLAYVRQPLRAIARASVMIHSVVEAYV